MNDHEEWRAIKGYEGIYEVSSHGRVRSLNREDSKGAQRIGKILSPGQDKKKGYLNVGLCKNADLARFHIHALVAETFIGPRPPGMEIGHKDHDPTNNCADNLEYITHAENMRQSAAVARMGKLSVSDIQDVREIFAKNPETPLHEIASILGVSHQAISNIVRARSYAHVPNRDGSPAEPMEIKFSLSVAEILDLQAQGFTIPQIAKLYDVEYSTPYQALRRAGIHQPGSTQGTGRRAAKLKQERAFLEGLPLFLK